MVDLVKQLREVEERDFDPASLKTMVLWGADEIERLRAALESVAQHKPGTPGLHFNSLEQLIESATGIAALALEQSPTTEERTNG